MKAFLSIIRYLPHPARGEVLNVGAALAAPALGYFRYDIPLRGQRGRLRCFDPTVDEDEIAGHVEWLDAYRELFEEVSSQEGRQQSAETVLHELTRTTASARLRVGSFQTIEFDADVSSVELDEVLRDAIEREVRWYKHIPAEDDKPPSFNDRVAEILRNERLYIPRSTKSPVKREFRIFQMDLEFDYGYTNSSTHVIETADIRDVSSENSMIEKASSIIVKYNRLHDAEVSGRLVSQRITLLSGARKKGIAVSDTIKELSRVSDLYFLGEDQDRRRLVERIKKDITPQLV